MIFEALYEASERGELFLVDGGMCRYHMRRDGVLTIREIIVLPRHRRHRLGRWMIARILMNYPQAVAVQAKCPCDLSANGFWKAIGFELTATSTAARPVNTWRKNLSSSTAPTATQPLPVVQ